MVTPVRLRPIIAPRKNETRPRCANFADVLRQNYMADSTRLDPNYFDAFFPDHTFFDDLVTMLVAWHSYSFALHVAITSNNPGEYSQRSLQEWQNYIRPVKDVDYPLIAREQSTDQSLVFYPVDLLNSIMWNSRPEHIRYRYMKFDDSKGVTLVNTPDHQNIVSRIIGSSYVNYFESQSPDLEKRHPRVKQWPPELNFARHVRNGFAHHGAFKIEGNVPGQWRIWKVDQTNNGQSVMRSPSNPNGLGIGDVIRLMEVVDTAVK